MTTSTLTLASFLLARIAEDEADAQPCRERSWQARDADTFAEDEQQRLELRHIARHDPARVLVECEAHKAIVALHHIDEDRGTGLCIEDAYTYPCETLRLLALPYADHPDYRPEWKS